MKGNQGTEHQRTRILAGFWVRLVCFAMLSYCLLSYTLYVLTPKHDYGICSLTNYYHLEKNTVDVLVLGTSLAYSGVNTNILWKEHGIATYNLCGAEMPYWAIYYYLEEALKTQSPRVILLDAKPAIYSLPYSSKGRVVLSTYGIRSPINRVRSMIASTHPDNTMKFVLGFSVLHQNYSQLTMNDFVFPPDNGGRGATWKGYIEMDAVLDFQPPYMETWSDTIKPLQDKQQMYLEKILRLATERGIPVLMVGFPNPDYAYDHEYYNAVQATMQEYGFGSINYNHPEKEPSWDYANDFADWQHLNVQGSVKLSQQLGKDLLALYDLPDRRGQPGYASYDACADLWFLQYPQFLPLGQEIE